MELFVFDLILSEKLIANITLISDDFDYNQEIRFILFRLLTSEAPSLRYISIAELWSSGF